MKNLPGRRTLARGAVAALAVILCTTPAIRNASAQNAPARVTEERVTLETYPFSEPNPIAILARDERLYPYHSFDGYAHESEPREWTVVHLENEWIEVWVLPEVGGKVWGARVKATGNEFIYRNEVMKFRNIALRGPWTSGGIEFNFGVVGHTPATATPVDYVTREHADGSVSVTVGTMDLPSRTHWRVEVRLPADAATFETRVLWTNPTPLEQPYYNWMTAAAFARDDLRMSIPGNAYLEHPGGYQRWPIDGAGRDLAAYDQNRFGGNKSFHVVGRFDDFFGGYFSEADYGFGHWARYEEMPGRKLWLWALSRQGGIWEDLLTDTDGQYVEYQAGRLLVQYTPTGEINPVSQVGFDPGRTDRWSESWFPLEGLGGLTDASRHGAMFVEHDGGQLSVRAQAFRTITDTLRVGVDGELVFSEPVTFEVLEAVAFAPVTVPDGANVVVELPRLGLAYHSDPKAQELGRPFEPVPGAAPLRDEQDALITAARELVRGRRLSEARPLFERVLGDDPLNRDALLGLADLEYRRGRYSEGLSHAEQLLRLDAYDAEHNFVAANLYRAAGRALDAREAYGWAARSTAFRSVSYVQVAEVVLAAGDVAEARHYAQLALDYDRYNLSALQLLAIVARLERHGSEGEEHRARLLEIDPLHHFVAAERYLESRSESAGRALMRSLRSEMPEQELLELVTAYSRRGLRDDARAIARLGATAFGHPLLRAWEGWLADDPARMEGGADPALVFPYRPETIEVLEWAVRSDSHWSWRYLLAMNLWGRDRPAEAGAILDDLAQEPDWGPFYAARAALAGTTEAGSRDREADLRRAVTLAPGERTLRPPLIQLLQAAGRWEDALVASAAARDRFPDDFNVALLHTQSLNELGRYRESIEILDAIAVLPSEHASMSHGLFAAAHTMAALDVIDTDPEAAARHLRTAMTWPERLGQGRPYEPDERLERYLLGIALRAAGDEVGARAAFEEVLRQTPAGVLDGSADSSVSRRDLVAVGALVHLGRAADLGDFGRGAVGAIGRVAEVVRSGAGGGDVSLLTEELARAVGSEPTLVAGVEGRLLRSALTTRALRED